MTQTVAGIESGQRQLNGPQTTGRAYRNLSEPQFEMVREDDLAVPTRDGTILQADVYRPVADGQFPVLIAASVYPRQIQDLGAPMGFIEAGASDFFVPRGYVHVIANMRGTGGSGGTYTLFDQTEREDLYDLVEWAAAQPWSDGNIGMIGISYFAMTQLAAAAERPPHLKAIFPFEGSSDLYQTVWHNGLLNSTFIHPWLSAVGVAAGHGATLWRGKTLNALRKVLAIPKVHQRFEYVNGEAVMVVLKSVMRFRYDQHPWDDLRYAACVQHPVRDEFWDERNLLPLLERVDIPVYLGCEWDNTPLHLIGSLAALTALAHNPRLRVAFLGEHGLTWPWESMHIEALAWFDHWLKGADSGIDDGPPIRYWLAGAEEWRTAEEWPPKESSLHYFALRVNGTLSEDEGESGERAYMCITKQFEMTPNVHPPELPSLLQWETDPLEADLDMAGNIELALDVQLSASDAAIIAVLLDVDADGTAKPITAGWLRASLRAVDENASHPGAPILNCREPIAVQPGEMVSYRVPIVASAHRFVAGHRVRLLICSDDQPKTVPTMLGFRHPVVAPAVQVSIRSSSRLFLPVLATRLE